MSQLEKQKRGMQYQTLSRKSVDSPFTGCLSVAGGYSALASLTRVLGHGLTAAEPQTAWPMPEAPSIRPSWRLILETMHTLFQTQL